MRHFALSGLMADVANGDAEVLGGFIDAEEMEERVGVSIAGSDVLVSSAEGRTQVPGTRRRWV